MTEQMAPGAEVVAGLGLSRIGFGAATLGDVYGDVDPGAGRAAVHAAIDAGIRLFDTSPYYGATLSESRLGAALEGRRDEVVLCSKAGRNGPTLPDGFDFRPERLRASVEASLRRLRTDRLDILLLHDVEFSTPDVIGRALPVLEELKLSGKTRAVGVSSYRIDVLSQLVATGCLDLVLSYCRSDLIDSSALERLAPLAAEHDVALLAASPLHMGLLTEAGPPEWHPAGDGARRRAEELRTACHELGVRLTDAALSYALTAPSVVSTLVGMSDPAEVRQNLAVLEDPVPAEVLDALVERVRDIPVEPWESGVWPL